MDKTNHCEPRIDFLAGRSIAVASKIFHLWGSIASDGTAPTYIDPTADAQAFKDCRASDGGLWQITTTAKEYRRNASEGVLLPLPDTAISNIPPGIDPFTRRTVVQIRVSANDGVDERLFDMDANQSITVVAQTVCVYWMGPDGPTATPQNAMRDVLNLPNDQRELPRSGMCIDSFLGISLSRIEEEPGDNSTATLTQHLFVPQATRRSIAIPAYAQSVTIYQEPTLGSASTSWSMTLGDPNGVSGFITVAALPFIAGLRKTQEGIILPNASHLRSDLDNDASRFYTLVWTIRP